MDQVTLNENIQTLKAGRHVLFRKGKHGFLAERTQNQLFNTLHRDHGAARMDIKRISDSWLSIRVVDFNGAEIINSRILIG